MSKPRISIIVPTYHTAKYLSKCLDSILNQTFQDFEVIIVSDGPKEDFVIIEQYAKKDNRITVLKDIKKGLGGARNEALKIAKGEFIWFIDSDDWIEPNSLSKICKVLFNNNIDLLVFSAKIKSEKFGLKQKGLKTYLKNKFKGFVNLDENVIFNTNVYVWNKIFKKSLIDEYQVRFIENSQYEDFPFIYFYCAIANNAYFLNDKLYNYFQRTESNMAKTFKNNYKFIRQHFDCLKFLHTKLSQYSITSTYFTKIFAIILEAGLKYCDKEQKEEFLNEAYLLYMELNMSNNSNSTLKLLGDRKFEKIITKTKMIYKSSLCKIIPLTVKITNKNKLKIYLFNKVLILSINLSEVI